MTAPLVTRDVAAVAAVLRKGGIAVYPTETFYGLGALAVDAGALARLVAAKLRPEGKPLPLVAADREMAFSAWREVPGAARVLADRFWPGPLTLVAPAAAGLPAEVAGAGTVGVRVPGSAVARELSRQAGGLLVSTSANPSGGPPPARVDALDPGLLSRVDAVLDGGSTPGGLPSTVVELADGGARLVRAGAVPWDDVEACLGGLAARSPGLP